MNMHINSSIFKERHLTDGHQGLVLSTALGLAVVGFAVYKLGSWVVNWLLQSWGTTKKTDEVAQNILAKVPEAIVSPEIERIDIFTSYQNALVEEIRLLLETICPEEKKDKFELQMQELTGMLPRLTDSNQKLIETEISKHPCAQQILEHHTLADMRTQQKLLAEAMSLLSKIIPESSEETDLFTHQMEELASLYLNLSPSSKGSLLYEITLSHPCGEKIIKSGAIQEAFKQKKEVEPAPSL